MKENRRKTTKEYIEGRIRNGLEQNMTYELLESMRRNPDTTLSTLDDVELEIVSMRYGLGEYYPLTFKQIGERVSLSHQRCYEIEGKARQKIWNHFLRRLRQRKQY